MLLMSETASSHGDRSFESMISNTKSSMIFWTLVLMVPNGLSIHLFPRTLRRDAHPNRESSSLKDMTWVVLPVEESFVKLIR